VERVTGIGGVFLRARDAPRLLEWYRAHLGVEPEPDGDAVVFDWTRTEGPDRPGTTTWALIPSESTYLGGTEARFMVNYRVADLDAMLDQLRGAGVAVDDHIEELKIGRFGWAVDPEGNQFELWEPPPGH
jgi:predicted enzyme related to lactoylglutathione lyase